MQNTTRTPRTNRLLESARRKAIPWDSQGILGDYRTLGGYGPSSSYQASPSSGSATRAAILQNSTEGAAVFPLYYSGIIAALIADTLAGGFLFLKKRTVTHARLKIDLEAVWSEAGRIGNQEFFKVNERPSDQGQRRLTRYLSVELHQRLGPLQGSKRLLALKPCQRETSP